MLSIDCEMTGLDSERCSILSIGVVDMTHTERRFYGECRVFEGALIQEEALRVNGFTQEDCIDTEKQTVDQLMASLYEFIEASPSHLLLGQNVYLDREFLNNAFKRAGIAFAFNHRIIELHSVAYAELVRRGEDTDERVRVGGVKHSTLNLDRILQYVGMPQEPRPHNALTGALVSAEAYHRIVYREKLLPEFLQFEIPIT